MAMVDGRVNGGHGVTPERKAELEREEGFKKKGTRYFLLHYTVSYKGEIMHGSILHQCFGFPSRDYITKKILRSVKKIKDPIILGIFEFKNKNDFNSFN